ncbi:MAG: hypothetical protein GF317_05285 [Candidatus Lokiarchaeota archaeon]|nr:hypothetical protein [Candidatus Lokiarchaeota archaeon]MBD3199220.1 hypothetical protein [Candidatus Lokiarchaeota archaeon]
MKIEALQTVSLSLLKTAIKNLIESGDLQPINGTSIQKIDGDISVLFRKKKS